MLLNSLYRQPFYFPIVAMDINIFAAERNDNKIRNDDAKLIQQNKLIEQRYGDMEPIVNIIQMAAMNGATVKINIFNEFDVFNDWISLNSLNDVNKNDRFLCDNTAHNSEMVAFRSNVVLMLHHVHEARHNYIREKKIRIKYLHKCCNVHSKTTNGLHLYEIRISGAGTYRFKLESISIA